MEEQNRTVIIYSAQKKMLEANYEMTEIRSLLNELMALEEMDEVIARANSYMAEAELRISRGNLSKTENLSDSNTTEIIQQEQKRIIAKLLSKGIVPAQIHQWLELPMEMILETAKEMNQGATPKEQGFGVSGSF